MGAAAGGGLPQWNCTCSNCLSVRKGQPNIEARTQSQLALTGDGIDWFLVNASPDLRQQLNYTPELSPNPGLGIRNTPVAGVILTSADLDHVLGLLLMREFTPVKIYATNAVRGILQANSFFRMLDRLPDQSRWTLIEDTVRFPLGKDLSCTPIALASELPAYVRGEDHAGYSAIGLLFETGQGKRIAYLPALPSVSPVLMNLLSTCSVLLVDGTFWSEDELQRTQPGTGTASSMGHLPMNGPSGSLAALRDLTEIRKIYTHINNTNPILDMKSPEYRAVCEAGWEVAWDGLEITI